MKKSEREIIYQGALDKWGERAQIEMAQEESTELALACRKIIRQKTESRLNDLASEIADVEIMIEQLKYMLPTIGNVVEAQKGFKLHRLEERVFNQKKIKLTK